MFECVLFSRPGYFHRPSKPHNTFAACACFPRLVSSHADPSEIRDRASISGTLFTKT